MVRVARLAHDVPAAHHAARTSAATALREQLNWQFPQQPPPRIYGKHLPESPSSLPLGQQET